MSTKIKEAVEKLVLSALDTKDPIKAMQLTQAALNAANARCALDAVK